MSSTGRLEDVRRVEIAWGSRPIRTRNPSSNHIPVPLQWDALCAGSGFAVFADQGPEFTFLVRDPDNHPTTTDLNKLFAHGALLTGSLRLPVAPFGLPGTQVFGGNWSSRHYTSLDPSDWENVPGQGLSAPEESGSWAIWYNADQTKEQALDEAGISTTTPKPMAN